MTEIAVILLAAGESRRMGERNKLLLPVEGEPLVRRMARILASLAGSSVTAARVTVVLGHQAETVAASLAGLPVTQTVNPAYAEGQRSSVYHGLSQAGAADGYLVTPADMPRLTAQDCAGLIAAHRMAPAGSVTVPMRPGVDGLERGNPVMLTPAARDEVVSGGVNLGCRGLLERRPDLVHTHMTGSDGFFVDIDTPDAYAAETGDPLPASARQPRRNPTPNGVTTHGTAR
ncbi:MAG: nucleotidyltransferase family protein [Candidatus Puniceispirillaceae bacterium]